MSCRRFPRYPTGRSAPVSGERVHTLPGRARVANAPIISQIEVASFIVERNSELCAYTTEDNEAHHDARTARGNQQRIHPRTRQHDRDVRWGGFQPERRSLNFLPVKTTPLPQPRCRIDGGVVSCATTGGDGTRSATFPSLLMRREFPPFSVKKNG
ncbi:hypothetical protein Pd630_LPD01248 [Rhodococcus opacus PD630]|nr:hypothetical protein Pd630_LPD01248 [Rhodococcus opacus PD630]